LKLEACWWISLLIGLASLLPGEPSGTQKSLIIPSTPPVAIAGILVENDAHDIVPHVLIIATGSNMEIDISQTSNFPCMVEHANAAESLGDQQTSDICSPLLKVNIGWNDRSRQSLIVQSADADMKTSAK
jgi:hypothetical protein